MYAATRYLCYLASKGVGSSSSSSSSGGGGGSSLGGVGSNYRNSTQLADVFHPVHHRNAWPFDHVLVDVSFFANSLYYLSRDLIGHERDRETVKNIHRQLQTVILRRIQPRKTLALLLDGSEPLWMLEHRRLFPGRRYDSRVYRSCASPMPYLLEERLRGTAMEQRTPPSEAVISGPATPGLAEGKMSAYLLDLATRIVRPPTNPQHLCAPVTVNDTVCLVGGPELAWMAVGMTPFHNITTVTLQQGELKSCSLQESMEWMRLDHLLKPASEQATGNNGSAAWVPQQRLAAARTDLVFLYLLTHGHPSTGLPQVLTTPFADVLDVYVDMERDDHSQAALGTPQNDLRFRSVLFDEEPVTAAHLERPGLRLRLATLERLLVRIVRSLSGANVGLPAGNRPISHAATLLEMTLQTHGLLCSGGVPSPAWTPTPDLGEASGSSSNSSSTVLLDKYPKLSAEMLLQHVTYLLSRTAKQDTGHSANGAAVNASGAVEGRDKMYLNPQRTRAFGLTGIEALLLSATQAEQVNHVLPLYARGHTLPEEVAADIVSTRNIHEALRKTQRLLSGVLEQASQELARQTGSGADGGNNRATTAADDAGSSCLPHPALTHLPSHMFVRTAGARGPPPGWAYYGIHLGIKAEAMNVRYSLNASDTATLRVIDSSGTCPRNTLYAWVAPAAAESEAGTESTRHGDAAGWAPMPCSALPLCGEGSEAAPAPAPGSLRILTWNTQFSLHSGAPTPLGREGIDWCSPTRYAAAARVLEDANADVLCLQEVEPAWAAYLETQPWVRGRYVLSSLQSSPPLQPYGVLMMVRRDLCPVMAVQHANIPGFVGHTSLMPVVTLQMGPNVAPVVVGGLHLLAPYSQTNEDNRVRQMKALEDHLMKQAQWFESGAPLNVTQRANSSNSSSTPGSTDPINKPSHVLVGDFNDYPTKPYRLPIELGYKDAWEVMKPSCQQPSATAEERGYTIDGIMNAYAQKLIEPKFYGRPDRVLFASTQLQPTAVELVGTSRVKDLLPANADGVHTQVDKPSEGIPDYLFPSDHFGVLVEFQIL
ncbi:hypothetical protein JKF63_07748 [Porcisia hertigi]|uniref:Endonuclease/exonuclease/phosphatase domain-containing protein n=1 Tax=Porcisia hertigi TaxID=2761500 RepID=A0A837AXR9_9TRYP|nr:hypothetical protein JKF63_07748 [Porcisia hertigi]